MVFMVACKTTESNSTIDEVNYNNTEYNFKPDQLEPVIYE
jgi:hypothetical protein